MGRGEGVGNYSWRHRGGQNQQPPLQGPLCCADGGGVGHQTPPQITAHATPEGMSLQYLQFTSSQTAVHTPPKGVSVHVHYLELSLPISTSRVISARFVVT